MYDFIGRVCSCDSIDISGRQTMYNIYVRDCEAQDNGRLPHKFQAHSNVMPETALQPGDWIKIRFSLETYKSSYAQGRTYTTLQCKQIKIIERETIEKVVESAFEEPPF